MRNLRSARAAGLGIAALTLVLTAGACGSDRDSEDAGSTGDTGDNGSSQSSATAFGDLESPCGEGDASGATDQGVTDDSITIGYGDDRGFAAAPGLNQELGDGVEGDDRLVQRAGRDQRPPDRRQPVRRRDDQRRRRSCRSPASPTSCWSARASRTTRPPSSSASAATCRPSRAPSRSAPNASMGPKKFEVGPAPGGLLQRHADGRATCRSTPEIKDGVTALGSTSSPIQQAVPPR